MAGIRLSTTLLGLGRLFSSGLGLPEGRFQLGQHPGLSVEQVIVHLTQPRVEVGRELNCGESQAQLLAVVAGRRRCLFENRRSLLLVVSDCHAKDSQHSAGGIKRPSLFLHWWSPSYRLPAISHQLSAAYCHSQRTEESKNVPRFTI